MRDLSMPLWERYLMTIEEASMYFRIGENKLREVANEHKDVCVLQNGNRMLIKKKKFEKLMNEIGTNLVKKSLVRDMMLSSRIYKALSYFERS